MTSWNKSPVGVEDENHVDSTFLVKTNFKLESLGLFGCWGVQDNLTGRNL